MDENGIYTWCAKDERQQFAVFDCSIRNNNNNKNVFSVHHRLEV